MGNNILATHLKPNYFFTRKKHARRSKRGTKLAPGKNFLNDP